MSFNCVKCFIENGDYNYNFENECDVEEYISKDTYDKYFIYRATDKQYTDSLYENGKKFAESIASNAMFSTLADCDGSGITGNSKLIHDIYEKLWSWNKGKDTFGKLSLGPWTCDFGGDTMNSVQTLLDMIIADIIYKPENVMLKDKKFPRGKVSIRYMLEIISVDCTRERLYDELNKIDGLKEYMKQYHSLGNFCLVPAQFNRWRGFNGAIKDNWSLSLKYLKKNGWANDFNISDFNKYINFFFLWDYYKNNDVCIIDAENDYLKYIEDSNNFMHRRGKFIFMLLHLYEVLGENDFRKMQKEIFLKEKVYTDYNEVIKIIGEYLVKDNRSNAWSIVNKTCIK